MIYFDHAATTKPYPEVIAEMSKLAESHFANPSAPHRMGLAAEKTIRLCAQRLSALLGVREDEIVFTSGGTESNNLAIRGAAYAHRRRADEIITLPTEHPSVYTAVQTLANEGFRVRYLDVDASGSIHIEQLRDFVTERTSLVSIMHVNNETGTIQDIAAIGALLKSRNPQALFHVDGVQGFTKEEAALKHVDLYAISAHKFHGPKGVGALVVKKGARIAPLLFGGEQQNRVRPGTENTAGIAGMTLAAEISASRMAANRQRAKSVRETLLAHLLEALPDAVVINSDRYNGSAFILNISFPGVRGETLAQALDADNIFVSTGAACHARRKDLRVLTALGIDNERASAAIRFSFSGDNTEEEAVAVAETLCRLLPALRLTRRKR